MASPVAGLAPTKIRSIGRPDAEARSGAILVWRGGGGGGLPVLQALARGALLDPTAQCPEIGCSIPHVECIRKWVAKPRLRRLRGRNGIREHHPSRRIAPCVKICSRHSTLVPERKAITSSPPRSRTCQTVVLCKKKKRAEVLPIQ